MGWRRGVLFAWGVGFIYLILESNVFNFNYSLLVYQTSQTITTIIQISL